MKKGRMKNRFFYDIKIIIFMCFIFQCVFMSETPAQKSTDLTNNLVRYLGAYVFNYPRCNPPGFEKFRWFFIEEFPDQNIDKPETDDKGFTEIDGYVETINDEQFKFKKATLKKNSDGNYEQFEFETETIDGTYFTFNGKFLNKSVNEGGIFTNLRGLLTRYKSGKIAAITNYAPFSKYANM